MQSASRTPQRPAATRKPHPSDIRPGSAAAIAAFAKRENGRDAETAARIVSRSNSTLNIRPIPYFERPKRRRWCRTGSCAILAPSGIAIAGRNRCISE
jgi:hypothetical protein